MTLSNPEDCSTGEEQDISIVIDMLKACTSMKREPDTSLVLSQELVLLKNQVRLMRKWHVTITAILTPLFSGDKLVISKWGEGESKLCTGTTQ